MRLVYPSLLEGSTLPRLGPALAALIEDIGAVDFQAAPRMRAERAIEADLSQSSPAESRDVPELPLTSREHDAYFGVRRVAEDPATGFVRALVAAHLDAPLDCVPTDSGGYDDSPAALFEGLSMVYGAAGLAAPVPSEPRPELSPDPMTVWIAGHRLFFALEQGAVIGLRRACEATDAEHRASGLRFASAFLRSSAAAMRLASAFDPQRYIEEVRPDMAPPKVSPGFSGLYTVDHRELVRAMVSWRSVLSTLPETSEAAELVASVRTVYVSHEFVCERFRGDHMPSLRSEAAVDSSVVAPSGVALAREFTRRRVNALRR